MTTKASLLLIAAAAFALTACDKGADGNSGTTAQSGPITPIAAPNGGDWTQTVSLTPEGGYRLGNPDAPVKLVEFGSMTCPHCAEFEEAAMETITNTYVKSGRVSFEFRNFVRDGLDLTASVIARCGGPTSFFGLTGQLFAGQKDMFARVQQADQAQLAAIEALPPAQKLPRFAELAGLKQWATMRGLPSAKLDQCLADQASVDRLVAMQSDATSTFQINATPSFLLNGELVQFEGSEPIWAQLEAKLRGALGS
ncbi:thioredoxin domain-containing protein [Sphingomonas mesophila]|uniref:thioredoxin domain-containing protein n=1 Tax=Sphingomonas mesophila TaxID=2303576 RepID=UPI0013C339FF|nr:thioredoxin domain-containing protein [Sphingomonas mesophila]